VLVWSGLVWSALLCSGRKVQLKYCNPEVERGFFSSGLSSHAKWRSNLLIGYLLQIKVVFVWLLLELRVVRSKTYKMKNCVSLLFFLEDRSPGGSVMRNGGIKNKGSGQ
jgi:hypothetical protein